MTIRYYDSVDYPPLTSVEEYPLHPDGIYGPGHIWACSAPGRPRDDNTGYDWRCRACGAVAEAALVEDGDHGVWWQTNADVWRGRRLLSWLVARSRFWFSPPPAGSPAGDAAAPAHDAAAGGDEGVPVSAGRPPSSSPPPSCGTPPPP